jgi:hypothetical protein
VGASPTRRDRPKRDADDRSRSERHPAHEVAVGYPCSRGALRRAPLGDRSSSPVATKSTATALSKHPFHQDSNRQRRSLNRRRLSLTRSQAMGWSRCFRPATRARGRRRRRSHPSSSWSTPGECFGDFPSIRISPHRGRGARSVSPGVERQHDDREMRACGDKQGRRTWPGCSCFRSGAGARAAAFSTAPRPIVYVTSRLILLAKAGRAGARRRRSLSSIRARRALRSPTFPPARAPGSGTASAGRESTSPRASRVDGWFQSL